MMPHFEVHATDAELAKGFYAGLLGKAFSPRQRAEEVEYHLIGGSGTAGKNGLTSGGTHRTGNAPQRGLPARSGTMTFEVADCDGQYDWALAQGGAGTLPPRDYPGTGRCVCVEDDEGNIEGIITPVQGDN